MFLITSKSISMKKFLIVVSLYSEYVTEIWKDGLGLVLAHLRNLLRKTQTLIRER